MKKSFSYNWDEMEALKPDLEKAVNMTVKDIVFNYLIKVYGQGFNELVGVNKLLAIVGLDRAIKMIKRANACTGDVCKCHVYGQDLLVSFYIH